MISDERLAALIRGRYSVGAPLPGLDSDYHDTTRILIAEQQRRSDGFVLVPREPTEEMLSCLIDGKPGIWGEGLLAEFYGSREAMTENYRAMLAAAPQV